MSTPKEIQLRKHKIFATGLFLLMVAIYIVTTYFLHSHITAHWLGYVHAFAEAAMVGALADWFAVTALFRYPMGLRIPHTNIIENKKKDIGENLGKFVKENFLNASNIRPYIENVDIVSWIAKWLKEDKNQTLLIQEIAQFIKKILNDLDDRLVIDYISKKVAEAIQQMDFSHILYLGLQYVLEKQEHIKLLDNILPQIKKQAELSQDLIRERVNKQRPLIGFFAGKKISKEFTQGIVDFIDEVDKNKNHWLRAKITEELEKFQNRIEEDENWKSKLNTWKQNFIVPSNIAPYIKDAWISIKKNTIENMEDPHSALMKYVKKNVEKVANDLQKDIVLQNRINSWVRKFAYKTILRNTDQVQNIIGNTVSQWKGRELSEKLELEVGKDLQFIRVNGTIVGGLVGLLIYTITLLLVH